MALASATSSRASASSAEGYTRLHITPLDAELLSVVIPAAVLPTARNISYHTLETFPERRYGFVDLPTADAEKLRKKLNGATLKGTKMRVDPARPEPVRDPSDLDGEAGKSKKSKREKKSKDKSSKPKKRKRDAEIEGVELEGRKIKRGWTVTESDKIQEKRNQKDKKSKDKSDKKDKKKREVKSKFTDEPECLFKQTLPGKSNSKDDAVAEDHKRKKRKSDRQVVMHEFEKTTKYPTFLKSNTEISTSKPVTFEDGKGWVDEEGSVVESVRANRQPTIKKPSKAQRVEDDDETSSSGSSSDDDSDLEEAVSELQTSKSTVAQQDDEETSSSGTSSEDDPVISPKGIQSNTIQAPPKKLKLNTEADVNSPASAVSTARPKSSGSATSLTIKIPPVTPAANKVHPLEALYKRPKGDEATPNGTAAESQPFSFFNDDDIEEEGKVAPPASQFPMTPFTRQDFDFRNIRSAAPTPDTAHPSRTFNLWPRTGSSDAGNDTIPEGNEDEAQEDEDTTMGDTVTSSSKDKDESKPQNSEFQDWFWENRGDLNRSWKKRRKTANKEKRNRENRARAAKAI